MNKLLAFAAAAIIGGTVFAAETATPAAAPAAQPVCDRELKPLDQWTPFQVCFLPGVPNAMWQSNVFGIKSGWPVTCGYGRVWGLEASWFYSGTRNVNGFQASWICCQADEFDGVQAAFVTCLNLGKQFNGLQASLGYVQSGDINGAQGGAVNLAKNVNGIQAGLLFAMANDVNGFQASGVCVNSGKLNGVQCNLYGQVKNSSGVQLGVVNVSGGKGVQFGAINIMKDAWIPVFPIFNFAF
ncbi:MAG: hypothetical protein PHI35_01565 [Victivallaceae bacterium]|nr:hypothetical protein [Victivallaceae bacterium]